MRSVVFWNELETTEIKSCEIMKNILHRKELDWNEQKSLYKNKFPNIFAYQELGDSSE